jgi:putative transposase
VVSDASVIRQAYRFSLDPTVEQEQFLAGCAGASRFWFNQGLALVRRCLDERAVGGQVDVPWCYKGLCVAFRGDAIKDELAPWRGEVVTGSYQAGLEALGKALQGYSAARKAGRKVGFPRFRAKGRSHEAVIFQRPRLPDSRHVVLDRRLGAVRTEESMRKLIGLLDRDPNARVLRATVQRTNGGWVISFTVERSPKRRRARKPGAVVGVDVGLVRLATLSTGHVVVNSRPLQAQLGRPRRLQRQLDRQRRANNPENYGLDGRAKQGRREWKKSRRMGRTERRIAGLHGRVANLRREQAHQLTTALAREFGVIGVETLAVKNLMRNHRLARHIADVGWGTILAQLRYKTSWSDGSMLVAAHRFYPSSKTCSACGAAKAKLRLVDRVFTCEEPACKQVIDRDLNAALNLARTADRHARAQGVQSYVARTGRFTKTARRGQVSLAPGERAWPSEARSVPGRIPARRRAGSRSLAGRISATRSERGVHPSSMVPRVRPPSPWPRLQDARADG